VLAPDKASLCSDMTVIVTVAHRRMKRSS
jgi:hypothetical protein